MNKYLVFDIETTGLNPCEDRITCFCAKDSEGELFKYAMQEEVYLLEKIKQLMNQYNHHEWISKNGKQFDLPFIITRMMYWGIYSKELCRHTKHFDLQQITKRRVSLNDMALLLGVETKSGTGLQAIQLWKEKKIPELIAYCMQDVEVTEQCYLKYKKNL